MVDVEAFGTRPKIPRTPTISFSNPGYEYSTTEPELPNPSLLSDSVFDSSPLIVSPRNYTQPASTLFSERHGDLDDGYSTTFFTAT